MEFPEELCSFYEVNACLLTYGMFRYKNKVRDSLITLPESIQSPDHAVPTSRWCTNSNILHAQAIP